MESRQRTFSPPESTRDLFHTVIAGKQHTSEEATYISCIFDLGDTGSASLRSYQIIVKLFGVVLWEIGLACGNTPFVSTFIRFHFAGQDLEESGFCKLVAADKSNLVIAGRVIKEILSRTFTPSMVLDKILLPVSTSLPISRFGTEINVRIFTAGRIDLIQLDFFQGTFSGSSLFGFGSVGS